MSCWHGPYASHGCGRWVVGPPDAAWYPPDSLEEDAYPRRASRVRRSASEERTDRLEADLDELRETLREVRSELARLREPGRTPTDTR